MRLTAPPADAVICPADDPFAPGNEDQTPAEVFAIRPPSSAANAPNWDLRVVPNRYSALTHESPAIVTEGVPAYGYHEVIIETPRCESRFAELSVDEIAAVFTAVQQRMTTLQKDPRIRACAYFKNEGLAAGASLPHVHSQLMAFEFVPPMLREELLETDQDWSQNGERLQHNWFERLIDDELMAETRIVLSDDQLVALCPYASRFAYETWFIPRRRQASFVNANHVEVASLATQLHRVLNTLMRIHPQLSYNLALHTAPVGLEDVPYYHWHLELYPRMNGLAGLECGFGCHINTVLPEQAAERLRRDFQSAN